MFTPIRSFDEYQAHLEAIREPWEQHAEFQNSLLADDDNSFEVPGFCAICDRDVRFQCKKTGGEGGVNWRESLHCENCGVNNRARAAFHYSKHLINSDSSIYCAEQNSAFFRALQLKAPGAIGSECAGANSTTLPPARHEDLTDLSFEASSFDLVYCFDVLEHIPAYMGALGELRRVLKNGGSLILTVPFAKFERKTLKRAAYIDGQLKHLVEPEYHGDPNNPEGCLAFYTFSWPLIGDLVSAGFRDACAQVYWSRRYGYFGAAEQLLIEAKA